MNTDAPGKVRSHHLGRNAYLYVRQSSLRQVLEHTESTERQYALKQRAIALGWHHEQVVVVDSDLGQSAASASDREGFQQLVTEVSLGRAGIVMGLEVSRLARNSTDWHRLLEICALADTLILDEDGIYDPAHFNDRLLLGLKGTMSKWSALHFMLNGKRTVMASWSAPALRIRPAGPESLTISIRSPLRHSMTRGEQQWGFLTQAVRVRERAGTRSMNVLRHSSHT